MSATRIHIFGASGSGTTTLGRCVSERLGLPQFDADDYFWTKTEPPFTTPHPSDMRARLLAEALEPHEGWLLSGSVVGWGNFVVPALTLAVFVYVPQELRMRRIAARERERYGARIEAGGDMFEQSREFVAWAARYDSAGFEQRSRVVHEAWIGGLAMPVAQNRRRRNARSVVRPRVRRGAVLNRRTRARGAIARRRNEARAAEPRRSICTTIPGPTIRKGDV